MSTAYDGARGGGPPLPEPPLLLGRLGRLRRIASRLGAGLPVLGSRAHTLGRSPCLPPRWGLCDGRGAAGRAELGGPRAGGPAAVQAARVAEGAGGRRAARALALPGAPPPVPAP